jgi:primosomal protein N'
MRDSAEGLGPEQEEHFQQKMIPVSLIWAHKFLVGYNGPMYVVKVIPLARIPGHDMLTYFSADVPPAGSLVTVPIKKRSVKGIVYDATPVASEKSNLKTAPFELRRMESVEHHRFIPEPLFRAVRTMASHHAAAESSTFASLVPKVFITHSEWCAASPLHTHMHHITAIPTALQSDDADRIAHHRGLIRSAFARGQSIIIAVPTAPDALWCEAELKKGIERYTFVLSGSLTMAKQAKILKTVQAATHPVVLIVSGGFALAAAVLQTPVAAFIIERAQSRAFRTHKHPHIDTRLFIQACAKETGIPCIISDLILPLELLYEVKEERAEKGTPFKWHSLGGSIAQLVDMRTLRHPSAVPTLPRTIEEDEKENGDPRLRFPIFGAAAKELLRGAADKRERIVVYAARRGLAPSVVCGDCQSVITCHACGAGVVLHEPPSPHEAYFLCHRCGERRAAFETCTTCGSWKLATVGIGIEAVAKAVKHHAPHAALFHIDSDSLAAPTALASAAKTAAAFYEADKGAVLVGTDMMLRYLVQPFHHAIVASIDSLLSLPDFRVHERILATFARLHSQATGSMIIHTRLVEDPFLSIAQKGDIALFADNALAERRRFEYPPFYVLVRLTLTGKKEAITEEAERIREFLMPHNIDFFPAFTKTAGGSHSLHGLIHVPAHDWPELDLVERLRGLPPHIIVTVDPDSLHG